MLKRFRIWLGFVAPSPARGRWIVILACGVGLGAALSAQSVVFATTTKQDAFTTLASAVDADELTRATIARQIGDDTLLAALHQAEDNVAQLAAVRCSVHLSDPDRALPVLSAIARGRDPDLAPAAALRVFQIAQALLQRGEDREIALDSVQAARSELQGLADDRSAIAAIRLLAGQTSYLLGVLVAQLAG